MTSNIYKPSFLNVINVHGPSRVLESMGGQGGTGGRKEMCWLVCVNECTRGSFMGINLTASSS